MDSLTSHSSFFNMSHINSSGVPYKKETSDTSNGTSVVGTTDTGNNTNIFDRKDFCSTQYCIPNAIIISLISISGVIMNLVVIVIVKVDKRLHQPTFVAIACLALPDFTYLVFRYIRYIIDGYIWMNISKSDYRKIRATLDFIGLVAAGSSVFHVVFMSVLRYFIIVHPLKSRSILTCKRPGKCYECGKSGHWRKDHAAMKQSFDKISIDFEYLSDCQDFEEFGISDSENIKLVASLVGQIISMQAAMGSVVRLRTRSLYECIMQKASWDSPVLIKEMAFDEVVFWKENVEFLNGKELLDEKVCTSVVYTDASGTGFGGYIVEYEESEVIGSWKPDEQVKRIQLGQTIEDEILAAGVTSDNFSTLADRMVLTGVMQIALDFRDNTTENETYGNVSDEKTLYNVFRFDSYCVPIATTLSAISIVGLVTNLMVIVTIASDRKIHQPTFVVICSLAVADFMFLFTRYPRYIIQCFFTAKFSVELLRAIKMVLDFSGFLAGIASIVHIVFISVVRYFIIVYPFRIYVSF
ncbi:unnamed protein product [Mytilus edulis]|uniref:G-protein coupled receptors family 1 profile domain-containing protein n=1 Tax=Mytilus edulis TaxID=6550 RepID=A0A8S3VRD6_MYTED|nr:unnamed protein product [Mytilus edulis]